MSQIKMVLATACLFFASSAQAYPITKFFMQGGWQGGGSILGYFTGEDLNNDGVIKGAEVSGVGVGLLYNSVVPNIFFAGGSVEWNIWNPYVSHVSVVDGGFVYLDQVISYNGQFITTSLPITITSIPEPAPWMLLLAALPLLMRRVKD